MAYFDDLTEYAFFHAGLRPGTKNVGWLAAGHEFQKEIPTDSVLDRIWEFCKISVVQTRGLHECEFCPRYDSPEAEFDQIAERNGERLLLGSAEIRVFGDHAVYAAPTLLYHYVSAHHYRPPI